MKKKSPPYAIIVAVVLGVVAVAAFFKYEKTQRDAEAAEIQSLKDAEAAQLADMAKKPNVSVVPVDTHMRAVLYATQPVDPGRAISPAFFEKKQTPMDLLPDAYTDGTDVVGWYAIRKIEKGDPLTPRNIGKSLPYMSQRIPVGMRAITLTVFNAGPVNDTGGFVVDGDRVDLLFSVESEDAKYKINTQTVMQNVSVLFVPGPPIKTDKTDGITPVGGPIAITFEVTPEQAEALVYMTNLKDGHFSMILRPRKDTSEVKVKPFNAEDYDWLNLTKVQKTVDKSQERVKQLQAEIEAEEKNQGQGTTNETTTPTPPSP